MMRKLDARLVGGLLLVVGGLLYLLQNLGLIVWGGLFWGAAAGVAGVLLLAVVIRDRKQWWAVIPALVLLAVAALAALAILAPPLADRWGGTLFLGAIGLSFWILYLLDRDKWWALIPGGVLVTLAAVANLDQGSDFQAGGIFFLGLAATFALVALLPTPHGQMRWAFIPAAVLLVFGLLLFVGLQSIINYIWPVALIIAGLFILVRAFRRPA
jgi:hypothetical protein